MTDQATTGVAAAQAETDLLDKVYNPKHVEERWYDVWEKGGYFNPAEMGTPYTIVIPPPNVTGSLHMGHALNSTLQDILIRYGRMRGDSALWVPGTDHGGIATQNVVEKILKEERTNRHKLGREKFVERMWHWRGEAGDRILMQLKKLGASLDWSRTRFTMDEMCSKAVKAAFVRLFEQGLLYRGQRLVNWCPRCNTALADIEVEHEEKSGFLWHIRYPVIERRKVSRPTKKTKGKTKSSTVYDVGSVVVATTRPETMLGDTAVAVNPKDKRYKEVVGATLRLPLTGRNIPVVADQAVDMTFGSGAVKVTPAHDAADFLIAERHQLPHVTVIGFDGKMTKESGELFEGLDRFDARKKIVDELERQGLIEKVENYKLPVSVCYRCDDVIEPLESEQWFLKVKSMAKRALDANKKGHMRIIPESWEQPYQLWLSNLKDWCVSRQIWWGHRIPVWYCMKEQDGELVATDCPPVVAIETPLGCPKCHQERLVQDPDVLDTWFSSALWPFSVFGWPEHTPDLKRFYPTSTLVTGHEILYLWVARMAMFGLHFLKRVPFSEVLIHGIVRDKGGRKMSKSLGNVIDPLDLINEYGADAMRFSLAQSAAPGRDMQISKDNFVGARNFSNKIWNATRFALMNLKGMSGIPPLEEMQSHLELGDRWILHEYNALITRVTEAMDGFDLDAASREIYDFFWGSLCDWYLEIIKPRLDEGTASGGEVARKSREAAQTVLATVLEGCLRLLHPFMPFITEELWQKVPKPTSNNTPSIMGTSWPRPQQVFADKKADKKFGLLKEIVTKLRAIRSEMGIPVTQKIEVVAKTDDEEMKKLLQEQEVVLQFLNSRIGKLTIDSSYVRGRATAVAVVPGADLYVPLEGLIDFGKERARLDKELQLLQEDAERLSKKMTNSDFLKHAPKEEVIKVQERLEQSKERILRLIDNIGILSD